MKKKIKSKLGIFKKWLLKKEYTGSFYKWSLVTAYKLYLTLVGKISKRKNTVYKFIQENVSEEQFHDKKYVNKLFNDILFCIFTYGIVTKEYFIYNFEMLSHEGRKTFVTRGNKYKYYAKFNDTNYTEYFNLKSETYKKFKKYYNRDVVCLYDNNNFDEFKEFIKKHPKFIYKPVDDYGGHGIEIFDSSKYADPKDLFKIVMANGFCVIEELIVQGKELAAFHPQSVNTVRVVAFRESESKANIMWSFLRMGMGGSHVDNMSSGGLAAMVDPETGIIYTTGRDWLNEIHIYHPDTGVQLIGYQLPEWDKLLELLNEIANVIPQVRFVGWDFAYTDKGWTFVEGNARPQCVSAQITEYNGKLHLYKAMDEIFEKQKEEEVRNG